MVEIRFEFSNSLAAEDLSEILRSAADSLGLVVVIERSMARLEGSRHWHLKQPGKTGTLEVTALADGQAWWVAYHSNRIGDGWVVETAKTLADRICADVTERHGPA